MQDATQLQYLPLYKSGPSYALTTLQHAGSLTKKLNYATYSIEQLTRGGYLRYRSWTGTV